MFEMDRDFGRYMGVISNSGMFRGIGAEAVEALLTRMEAHVETYAKGDLIYRCGDEMREVALVLEGSVVVESSDEEGADINLRLVNPGDEFGAFMVVAGETRCWMNISAGSRCAILMFNLSTLGRATTRDVDELLFLNNITRDFARKCMYLYEKVQIYAKKRIRSRLKLYLMTLKREDGAVTLPMNRTMLSAYLGVDRTAMARELSRMQQEGLIEIDKRTVRILDEGYFQREGRKSAEAD